MSAPVSAPKYVATDFRRVLFIPDDPLPDVPQTGVYISDQTVLDAVWQAAVESGVVLVFSDTPLAPPEVDEDDSAGLLATQAWVNSNLQFYAKLANVFPENRSPGLIPTYDADGNETAVDPDTIFPEPPVTPLRPLQTVVDQTLTTSFVNDNVFGYFGAVGELREIDIFSRFSGPTDADVKMQWVLPAGATVDYSIDGPQVSAPQSDDITTATTRSYQAYDETNVPVGKFGLMGGVLPALSSYVITSNVATITLASSIGTHLTVGDTITMAVTTSGQTFLNGEWIVTAVSGSTFSFAITHANVTTTTIAGYAVRKEIINVHIHAYVAIGATSGNVHLQLATNAASVTAVPAVHKARSRMFHKLINVDPTLPGNDLVFTFANAPTVSFTLNSPDNPWNIQLGPDYGRFELKGGGASSNGDQWIGDYADNTALENVSRKQRVEVVSKGFPLQTHLWAAASMRLGAMPINNNAWTVLFQMHQRPESSSTRTENVGKSPTFDMRVEGGFLKFGVRGDAQPITTQSQIPLNVLYQENYVADNTWHDYVFHMYMDWTGGGILEVWRDGTLLFSSTGILFGFNDTDPNSNPTFVLGLYRQRVEVGDPGDDSVAEYSNINPPQTTTLSARIAAPLAGHT